ncbi:hypothetical protein MLD38_016799 [Melastoma candidum]|uniref:Uncharacterized protein n=1 Tax=Melastoma candidum TaxID=119954 RepID=A0ACB9QNH1_9MYRT|nr:hypothetical protein MLD38_016799 [Melastoma candidum]
MVTKMKGFCKGFKFFSHMFAAKEREMEIGLPTDVKHLAHIGWDANSGGGPSWMRDFGSAPDFLTSLGSIGDLGETNSTAHTTWSSQDFELQTEQQATSEMLKDNPPTDLPNIPKKQKWRSIKSTSSTKPKPSLVDKSKPGSFLHLH